MRLDNNANSEGETPQALQRTDLLLVFAIAAGAVILCLPVLRTLVESWRNYHFYSHVLIMCLVAAWSLYSQRAVIANALSELRSPPRGILAVLAAAAFVALTYVGDIRSVAGVGFAALFGAVAYAIAGSRLLRALALPLCCLALTVPFGWLMNPVLAQLKPLVGQLAVTVLQTSGTPASAQGFHVELPGQRLVVANPSSGFSSMLSVAPIALLIAYARPRSLWRRALIVTSAIPPILLLNVIRVVVAAKLMPSLGQEQVQGLLRSDLGIPIVAVSALVAAGVARLLR